MRIRTLRTPRQRASGRRKAGTGALLLLGLFAGLVGLAPAASAHHPEMTASVVCGPTDGTYVVTVDAESWTTGNSGVHEDIDLYWGPTSVSWPGTSASAPAGAIAAQVFERDGVAATGDGGQFLSTNGYDFVAKFQITTALSQIEVIAHADGGWGVDNNLAGNEWRGAGSSAPNGTPTTLTLPTDCDYSEPDLELGPIVECVQGGISITIENDGDAPGSATVTYTIDGGGQQQVSFPSIAPQGELTKFIAIPENATYTLSFAGDFAGNTPAPIDDVLDCLTPPAPAADVQWTCGADATVVLTNTGGESVTATITKNGQPVHSNVAVPGDYTVAITGADENTEVEIEVTFSDAGTATDLIEDIEVDCDQPAPTIANPVCAEGGLAVTLGNTGDDDATFTIVIGGVETTETVAPDASRVVLIPVAEDATVSVSITSGDVSYVNQSLTRDCAKPAATVEFDCAEGGVVVTLTNTGTETATVDVDGEQVPVGPGATVERVIPVLEGAAYDITVLGQTAEGVRDCEQPAATVVFDCAEGGVVVTVTNSGQLPTTVDVDGNPVVVNPGVPYSTVIPVAEGEAYDVTVTGDDDLDVGASGTRDCEEPAASVTFECAAGGVVVELTNSGELPTTVDVAGEQVEVPAGTTPGDPVVRTIPVAEGEAYDITVLGQTAEGVRDCEQPAATVEFDCAVGGVAVTVTNSGQLPTTVNVDGNPVVVNPGVPYSTVIPVAEGEAYDVTVTGDDDLDVGASGTRDCEQAGLASAVLDCAEGGVVVTLTNTGELPAAVTVDGDVVVIPAGGETSVVVPVAENATYDFDIVIDGSTTTITGERDCEQPGLVSALVECAEGGVVVALSNTGVSDTTVTVDGDEVVVPAGGTAEVLVPVAENGAYDFTVEGDELSEQVSGTLDCEIPQVESIQIECAEGGVVVVITNDGELPTTVTVDGVEHEVPAGETVEILVEIEEDEDYSFTVEGDGIEQIVEGTYDCDLPEPSVDDEVVCAVGGLGVVLRNTGDDTATFVITSPALADGATEAVLEAGDTQTVLIPVAEDASTEVVVTSGGQTLLDDTLTRDCEQVEGEQTPPTQVGGTTTLPRTGGDARSLLALAGALLLAGAALAFGGRRQVELA